MAIERRIAYAFDAFCPVRRYSVPIQCSGTIPAHFHVFEEYQKRTRRVCNMADHWKSLANRLGAPGVDLPEETQGEPISSKKTESQPIEESASSAESLGGAEGAQSEFTSAQPAAQHEQGTAEELGFGKGDDLEPESERDVVLQSGDQPDSASSEAKAPPEVISAVQKKTSAAKARAEASKQPKKQKRKASWESLARLFNIQSEREPENEPESAAEALSTEPAASAEVESEREQREDKLPLFGEEPSDVDSNSALKDMFGEVPRKPAKEWRQKRRVVDDISWDEDLEELGADEDEELTAEAAEEADDIEAFGPVDEDVGERPRRSSERGRVHRDIPEESGERRGRRRRRRGRGREGRTAEPAPERDWEPAPVEAESDSWDEGDIGFVAEVFGDEEEFDEVERRSSRRRRRGRRAEAPTDVEQSDFRESAFGPETEAEEEDAGLAERPAGRRRKPRRSDRRGPDEARRGEASRRGEERTRAEASSSQLDEPPEADADDAEDAPAAKHRNIPTWTDALRTIIDFNTDNHRRNENRGQRGRPRGRR
jgi:hypothetical protein